MPRGRFRRPRAHLRFSIFYLASSCDCLFGLQNKHRFLELSKWQVAWDRYALGASALGQLAFDKAMMHKATVLEARQSSFICIAHIIVWHRRLLTKRIQKASHPAGRSLGSSTMTQQVHIPIPSPLLFLRGCLLRVRKIWEERSAMGGPSFRASDYVKSPHEEALRRAKAAHDLMCNSRGKSDNTQQVCSISVSSLCFWDLVFA